MNEVVQKQKPTNHFHLPELMNLNTHGLLFLTQEKNISNAKWLSDFLFFTKHYPKSMTNDIKHQESFSSLFILNYYHRRFPIMSISGIEPTSFIKNQLINNFQMVFNNGVRKSEGAGETGVDGKIIKNFLFVFDQQSLKDQCVPFLEKLEKYYEKQGHVICIKLFVK
jgi:hypothetical protein